MQLADWQERFAALGVNVAGMTYDEAAKTADFIAQEGLGYPILQDEDAQHVNAFGIRNVDYEPDSRFYGIPYPGILFIAPDGTVRGKYAEPGYRSRPEFEAVLASVAGLVAG